MSDFIVTASGGRFSFADIMDNEVKIEDVASALSKMCRFGGHCPEFYSVAQHSVIVSHLVPHAHALSALLHDATEAYVQDVVRPVKRQLPEYSLLESKVAELINATFDVWTEHPSVKVADNQALYAEAMNFFGSVEGWQLDEFAIDLSIDVWEPRTAETMFLHRFAELTEATSDHDPFNMMDKSRT